MENYSNWVIVFKWDKTETIEAVDFDLQDFMAVIGAGEGEEIKVIVHSPQRPHVYKGTCSREAMEIIKEKYAQGYIPCATKEEEQDAIFGQDGGLEINPSA